MIDVWVLLYVFEYVRYIYCRCVHTYYTFYFEERPVIKLELYYYWNKQTMDVCLKEVYCLDKSRTVYKCYSIYIVEPTW
jgi:hypothetical protein